jgi:hypothetical protein
MGTMTKKFFLINFVLSLVIIFLAERNYREWTSPLPAVKEIADSRQKTIAPVSPSPEWKKEVPNTTIVRLLSDKNIFSPDRKEFPVAQVTPEIVKPPVRPNLQLFGVAVGPEFLSAIINNPTRRADRGERETMSVRKGDRVGEYKVAAITEDRITLESSDDTFDVLLYDPKRKKRGPAVASQTTPTPPVAAPPPAEFPSVPLVRPQIPPRRRVPVPSVSTAAVAPDGGG